METNNENIFNACIELSEQKQSYELVLKRLQYINSSSKQSLDSDRADSLFGFCWSIWRYDCDLWIATVSWWFFQSYIFVAFIVHFARLFLMRIPMFPHSSFEAETWKKWQSQFFRMSMSLSVLHLCSWIATLSRLICLQPFISW